MMGEEGVFVIGHIDKRSDLHYLIVFSFFFLSLSELSLFKWSTNNQLLNTFLLVFLLIVSGSHYSSGLKSSSTNSYSSNNNKSVNSHVKCSMAEFTCANGKCITLNKFCNNLNDCGDSSDEPRFCTSEY
jgi:preprotein translocase subunit SecE